MAMATTTAVMGGVCNTGTAAVAVASSSQQKVTGTGCQSLFWGAKSGSARFVKAAVSTRFVFLICFSFAHKSVQKRALSFLLS
jgi:hypothetical protein